MTTTTRIRGTWGWAGETDAPVGRETLEEIAGRNARSAVELLDVLPPGRFMFVTVAGGRLAARTDLGPVERHEGRPVAVVELAGQTLTRAFAERVTPLLRGPRRAAVVVLDAPDLSLADDGGLLDGVVLRGVLDALAAHHPDVRFVGYVGEVSFVRRHALPGTLRLHLSPGGADAPGPRSASFAEAEQRLDAATAAGPPAVVPALADVIRHPGYDLLSPPSPVRRAISGEVADALAEELRAWLRRRFPSGTTAPEPDHSRGAAAFTEPRVGAGVYRLLALAASGRRRGTLRGVDVGRWLNSLRASSYEVAAVATASLSGEDLSGLNLFHAPPLEFCDLRDADLSGTDAYRINVAEGDLRGTCLRDTCLSRGHLKQARLQGADLSGADASYASFEQANLTGAVLTGTDLNRSILDHAIGMVR
jgi:hypothetical protein